MRDYSHRRYRCEICKKVIPAAGRKVIMLIRPPLQKPQRFVVCSECFRQLSEGKRAQ